MVVAVQSKESFNRILLMRSSRNTVSHVKHSTHFCNSIFPTNESELYTSWRDMLETLIVPMTIFQFYAIDVLIDTKKLSITSNTLLLSLNCQHVPETFKLSLGLHFRIGPNWTLNFSYSNATLNFSIINRQNGFRNSGDCFLLVLDRKWRKNQKCEICSFGSAYMNQLAIAYLPIIEGPIELSRPTSAFNSVALCNYHTVWSP